MSDPSSQSDEADRIREAGVILGEIMSAPDKAIPASVLERAEAIAVFPSTIKGAFIVGAQRAAIRQDQDSNDKFYGSRFRTRDVVLDGKATKPQSAEAVAALLTVLQKHASAK